MQTKPQILKFLMEFNVPEGDSGTGTRHVEVRFVGTDAEAQTLIIGIERLYKILVLLDDMTAFRKHCRDQYGRPATFGRAKEVEKYHRLFDRAVNLLTGLVDNAGSVYPDDAQWKRIDPQVTEAK